MESIENRTFGEERALYGSSSLLVKDCKFDGPEDGESALKESSDIKVEGCYCNLRYPFWHDIRLDISSTAMTELCRAPLWYSQDIRITDSKLHGVKALRECSNVDISDCDIVSTEFGWSVNNISLRDSYLEGEYCMMRSSNIAFSNVRFKGKYSFQYVKNVEIANCELDTKDAFWHAENVVIRDSVIKGEYLAWYCNNVTFINCKISGTQPFCYCKGLKLINCEMNDADLAFEKSEVEATILTPVISIKNPYKGSIELPYAEELILTDPEAKCEIREKEKKA